MCFFWSFLFYGFIFILYRFLSKIGMLSFVLIKVLGSIILLEPCLKERRPFGLIFLYLIL